MNILIAKRELKNVVEWFILQGDSELVITYNQNNSNIITALAQGNKSNNIDLLTEAACTLWLWWRVKLLIILLFNSKSLE